MNTGSRGLIHMIFNDFGPKICQQFLDDLQNIVTRYLILSGFSVGISDLIADKDTNDKIRSTIIESCLNYMGHEKVYDDMSIMIIKKKV